MAWLRGARRIDAGSSDAAANELFAAERLISGLYSPVQPTELLAKLTAIGFDGEDYRDSSANLSEVFSSAHRATLHFLAMVRAERRVFPLSLRADALPAPKYAEEYVTPAVEAQIESCALPVVPFLGKKGDVLIWHGRLMHRGSLARVPGAERRSLITHYSGVNHRPDMPDRQLDPETGGGYAVFDHAFR